MRYSGGGAALCLELCDVLHMQRSIDTHSMYDVGRLCQLPTIWGSVRVSLNCRSSYIPYIYHLTNSKVKIQVAFILLIHSTKILQHPIIIIQDSIVQNTLIKITF